MSELISLAELTEEDRKYVFDKYKIIEPYINNQGTLKEIAQRNTIPRRTLSSWVNKYKEYGLVGLFRQVRRDKGAARKIDKLTIEFIEALYLQHPNTSSSNIHKLVSDHCKNSDLYSPSYRAVCKIISNIPDDLL